MISVLPSLTWNFGFGFNYVANPTSSSVIVIGFYTKDFGASHASGTRTNPPLFYTFALGSACRECRAYLGNGGEGHLTKFQDLLVNRERRQLLRSVTMHVWCLAEVTPIKLPSDISCLYRVYRLGTFKGKKVVTRETTETRPDFLFPERGSFPACHDHRGVR